MECLVCGNGKVEENVGNVSGIWKNDHAVSYCPECGLYFLNEMPTEEEMHEYYSKDYFSKKSAGKIKDFFRKLRSRSQVEYLSRHIELCGKSCFEVGAADGALLSLLKKRGSEVLGSEYSILMRDIATKRYGIDLEDVNFFDINGKYDIIAMSHVFEHFTDIHAVLEHCTTILNNDGKLFLEVPFSPALGDCLTEDLDFNLNTTHTHNFTIKAMTRVLENNGYEIVNIGRFINSVPFSRNAKISRVMSHALMTGKLPSFGYWPLLGLYLAKIVLFSGMAFKELSVDDQWSGLGDTIRVIAKKK